MKTEIFRKIILISALPLLLALLGACEETIDGVNLPYKEQLVVRCILETGKPLDGVAIERTLPPQGSTIDSMAWVRDADARISCEGREYKLEYDSAGLYSCRGLVPAAGKSYSLNVRWKGMACTASTHMPLLPEKYTLDTAAYPDIYGLYTVDYLILFKPVEDQVCYMGSCQQYGKGNYMCDTSIRYPDYYTIYLNRNAGADGLVRVVMASTFASLPDKESIKNTVIDFLRLEVYDVQFYAYYSTKGRGMEGDDIFGPRGENPIWNVKGDGFGVFAGRSVLRVPVKKAG